MRTFASVIAKRIQNDSLAQLVEQLTLNQWVEGSNPSGVTKDDESRPFFVSIPPLTHSQWQGVHQRLRSQRIFPVGGENVKSIVMPV